MRTLPAPRARRTARFATLNDLHFGEPRFGGQLTADHEYGDEAEGFPLIRADDTEVPYWRVMNEDAIAEINAAGVDAVVIKGDIADRGLPEQFGFARDAFAKIRAPHHAFLGNHDYYGRHNGAGEVDGYALLGQDAGAAHASISAAGAWCCSRRRCPATITASSTTIASTGWRARSTRRARRASPTLLLMHHQPVPPEHRDSYPNSIGMLPEHSRQFFDLIGVAAAGEGRADRPHAPQPRAAASRRGRRCRSSR